MNDSWLAGIWHCPQQTLCSKLVRVRMKTALPLLLTDLAWAVVSACSLCSSNVHSSRPCILTSCVQSTMPSIGCANCAHIRLRVCSLPLKISFGCCQAVHWRTSLILLPTPAGASPHSSSSSLLPPSRSPTPSGGSVRCSILGSSEYRMRSTVSWQLGKSSYLSREIPVVHAHITL